MIVLLFITTSFNILYNLYIFGVYYTLMCDIVCCGRAVYTCNKFKLWWPSHIITRASSSAHIILADYRPATYMHSDALTHSNDSVGSIVNHRYHGTHFCFSVTGSPLRFTHVRMAPAIWTSEKKHWL